MLNGNEEATNPGDLYLTPGSEGEITVGTHKITNVVDPGANQDAATKKYVDDQITAGALSTYDSGWFAATAGNADYSKTHGLGTTAIITQLYFATNDAGANMFDCQVMDLRDVVGAGSVIKDITTTTLKICVDSDKIAIRLAANGAGTYDTYASGYLRVIALAIA